MGNPIIRITEISNKEFSPTPLEILAEELTVRIGPISTKKDRKRIVLEFFAQKELTGEIKIVQ